MPVNDQATVTVELMDSADSDEGPFRSAVLVRISSPDKQACEMVKEAIQLAIQEALGHEAPGQPSPGATASAPQLPVNQ
jgi:hypothetical protein